MEENFKQIRLQDRQDEKNLEKKCSRKVSLLIICFAILFLNLYSYATVALEIKVFENQLGAPFAKFLWHGRMTKKHMAELFGSFEGDPIYIFKSVPICSS